MTVSRVAQLIQVAQLSSPGAKLSIQAIDFPIRLAKQPSIKAKL